MMADTQQDKTSSEPEDLPEKKEEGPPSTRDVFVFFEGKTEVRKKVETALMAWDLNLHDLDQAFDEACELRIWMKRFPQATHAVVLLSGECFVYPREGKPSQAYLTSTLRHAYVLGYLIASFGKNGVSCLVKAQTTYRLPVPQYEGVFIPLDETGAWKEILKNRLKMCSIDVS